MRTSSASVRLLTRRSAEAWDPPAGAVASRERSVRSRDVARISLTRVHDGYETKLEVWHVAWAEAASLLDALPIAGGESEATLRANE